MVEDEISPYLTRERETELIAIAQGDDREAASAAIGEIIHSNIPMLKWFAKKLRRIAIGLPYADRMSAAKIGMIRAIMSHDLSRGTKLSTSSWYPVKRQLDMERHKDWAWFGESTNCLRSKKPKGRKIQEHLRRFRSKPRASGLAALDVPDAHVDLNLEVADAAETIRVAIATLSDREAMIIRSRFGLDGQPRRLLAEIGADLGITKERVRMIEKEALRKLRNIAVKNRPSFRRTERLCPECGRQCQNRTRIYCSVDCYSRHRSRPKDPERFCRWCSNTLKRTHKSCCSLECRLLFDRHQRETQKKSAPIVLSDSGMELNSYFRNAMIIERVESNN